MTLYDRLPDGVTVDGRFYKLDFDFRNVLRMMDTLDRDDLIDGAREYLALKCLTKRPRNVGKVLPAVRALLFQRDGNSGKGQQKQTDKVTSFEQDAGMIRAAFLQVYRIDLFTVKMHWLQFSELLRNLPDGNRYTETVSIRCRPIPAPTKYNAKEREWLIKAKAQCKLYLTEKEAKRQYTQDIGNVFAGLMAMMQKDVNNNGK